MKGKFTEGEKKELIILVEKDHSNPLYCENFNVKGFDISERIFINNLDPTDIVQESYKVYSFDPKEDRNFINFRLSKIGARKRIKNIMDASIINPDILFKSIELKVDTRRESYNNKSNSNIDISDDLLDDLLNSVKASVPTLPSLKLKESFFQPKNMFKVDLNATTTVPSDVVKVLENNNFRLIEDNQTESLVIDSCRAWEGKSEGKPVKRIFINTPEGSLYYDKINDGFFMDSKSPLSYSPDMRIVEKKVLNFLNITKEELPLWSGEKYREGYRRQSKKFAS